MKNFYLIKESKDIPFILDQFDTMSEAELTMANMEKSLREKCKIYCPVGTKESVMACMADEITSLKNELRIATDAKLAKREFYKRIKEILEENDISTEDLIEHCVLW